MMAHSIHSFFFSFRKSSVDGSRLEWPSGCMRAGHQPRRTPLGRTALLCCRSQALSQMLRAHKRSAVERAADWVEYTLDTGKVSGRGRGGGWLCFPCSPAGLCALVCMSCVHVCMLLLLLGCELRACSEACLAVRLSNRQVSMWQGAGRCAQPVQLSRRWPPTPLLKWYRTLHATLLCAAQVPGVLLPAGSRMPAWRAANLDAYAAIVLVPAAVLWALVRGYSAARAALTPSKPRKKIKAA